MRVQPWIISAVGSKAFFISAASGRPELPDELIAALAKLGITY
jgi:hypothetical protein